MQPQANRDVYVQPQANRDVYVQPQANHLHSAAADVVCADCSLLAAKASLGKCLSALASETVRT